MIHSKTRNAIRKQKWVYSDTIPEHIHPRLFAVDLLKTESSVCEVVWAERAGYSGLKIKVYGYLSPGEKREDILERLKTAIEDAKENEALWYHLTCD